MKSFQTKNLKGLSFTWLIGVAMILAIGMFPGCKPVGPDYIAKVPALPDAWEEQINLKLAKEPTTDLESWWGIFNDPVLDSLIEKAKANNKNLKIAYSRMLEARANVAGVSGKKLPEVSTDLTISESKVSDDGSLAQVAPDGGFKPQSLFSVGMSATWEIDVFGRVRRSVEVAGMEYQVSVEDYYDIMVILMADVALNYMDVRSYQQLIINTELSADIQQESLELAQFRYEMGLTSYLDVLQAKSNLAETKASIPTYRTEAFFAISRLAVLLGTTRDSLNNELFEPDNIPKPDANIAMGLPTDLLRQRPDIRAAERDVAKYNAKIGVATADLYPTFALSGFLGFSSRSVTNLFSVPGLNWGASLPISWNIFNRKRIRANIAMNEQKTQQALLNYENIVLQAYAEVEDALVSINMQNERYTYLSEAVNSSQEAVSIVGDQYDSGLTDFQNVLDTERSMFRQQNHLIESEKSIVTNVILLYKALGGGWEVPQDTIPPTSPVKE
jgi:NodT family efflux transporter outer membrane factor (OMF) lipoprotein